MSSPLATDSEARRIAEEAQRLGIGLSPAASSWQRPDAELSLPSDEDVDLLSHIQRVFGLQDDELPLNAARVVSELRGKSEQEHNLKIDDDVLTLFPKPGRESQTTQNCKNVKQFVRSVSLLLSFFFCVSRAVSAFFDYFSFKKT